MAHSLYQVGVKALITNDENKVLVLKTIAFAEDEPHWDLAGGRIEDGQTPEDALRREILEETGITTVDDISFFAGCFSNIRIPISNTEKVGLILMAYRVRVPQSSAITISKEHTEFAWVDFSEAAQRLSYKYPKDFTDTLLKA